MLRYIIKIIFKLLELIDTNHFYSYVKRAKYSDNINAQPDINNFENSIYIIMQGPIILENNFTLETAKLYKKRFPNTLVVLSTWKGYKKNIIEAFKENGALVLENTRPPYSGISNINLQIESTKSGLEFAKQRGAEYCLKTRTDQRIYRHDFLLFFLSLIKVFPIKNNSKINKRLISVSLNTYKYRLYGITDMLMFGDIDDMLLYWSPSFDMRKSEDVETGVNVIDWGKARLCEIYLETEFLKKIEHDFQWSFKDSWEVLSKYFCIIDKSSIDLFWFKYDRFNEYRTYSNKSRTLYEEFYFTDWINSYNENSFYKDDVENYLYKINNAQI